MLTKDWVERGGGVVQWHIPCFAEKGAALPPPPSCIPHPLHPFDIFLTVPPGLQKESNVSLAPVMAGRSTGLPRVSEAETDGEQATHQVRSPTPNLSYANTTWSRSIPAGG